MPDFTPDDMESFGREAMKPYLQLKTFMTREVYSYGAKTNLYVRTAESEDKNWAVGLMCLEFRTGVLGVVAEFWECYEGEGRAGLDERWDIGTAWFAKGADENQIADLLGYVAESERLISQAPVEFGTTYRALQEAFNRLVKSKELPLVEPEVEDAAHGRFESAHAVVQKIIDASAS